MKIIGVFGLRGFPNVMGGVERHCEQLYPRIAAAGYQIVVCRRMPYINVESKKERYYNVDFIDLRTPKLKSLEAIIHSILCVIVLRVKGVKIVHIHSFGPALVAPLSRMLGQKVVMTYHLPNYQQGKWNRFEKWILLVAEKIACASANKIIAVSAANAEIVQRNTGRECIVIPNGITPPTALQHDVSSFGIEPNKYFFAASRFVPEKGIDTLITAYNQIQTDWPLVIAGSADHESDYSRMIVELSKQNPRIILAGFQTGIKLESLFALAGLFVQPSYIEGLPIALLEAMSFGIPVLVSDIPAHREMKIGDHSLFKPGDSKMLAKYLVTALVSQEQLRSEAQKLKGKICQKYNWDAIAIQTKNVYEEL
jgi:glycosyltransferase involved in cell wall biosynthesis